MFSLQRGLTTAQVRRVLADAFGRAGVDAPELDARLLTGHALGLSHTRLALEPSRVLDDDETTRLAALAVRRLGREPVARILGRKEFWGLELGVTEASLVPRPETETVVEAALAAMGPDRCRPLRIADLGTGTGALLLALLHEMPNASGIGTDISDDALRTAVDNALRLGLNDRAQFIARDFGVALVGRFDLIVSNPPYIASADIAGLPPEVRHDPRVALDGGADGLDCYRIIARQMSGLLQPRGAAVVELGQGQEAAVADLFRAAGLVPEPARADLAGIPRALLARVAAGTP